MWYIGIDLHTRTFTMVVLSASGDELFSRRRSTSSRDLRESVEALSGEKQIVVEESTLAGWAYRTLDPVGSVVVADPRHNRSIGADEKLDDEEAARKLARLLRLGEIKAVHHTTDLAHQGFKELVAMYHEASNEVVRARNRLKAKFAQHGVLAGGRGIYEPKQRDDWREQLPTPAGRYMADQLWSDLDHMLEKRRSLHREIARLARDVELIDRLQTVPGIGLIRATTFYTIVDTIERFASRRRLWSYCGIGLAQRKSGDSTKPPHLTRRGNPRLKNIAKGAAVTAISAPDTLFAEQYEALLGRGCKAELARLTIARAIISTLYALWRDGTTYDRSRRKGDGALELPPNCAVRD